jgi:hypothetical protein
MRHDLAEVAVQVAGLDAPGQEGALAERDEQLAVRRPDQPAAGVHVALQRRLHAEDDLHVLDARLWPVDQPGARNVQAVAAGPLLRVAQ